MENVGHSWVSPMTGKVYADDFGHESEFFEYELCSSECYSEDFKMFALPKNMTTIVATVQKALFCAQNDAILHSGIVPTLTSQATCVPSSGKAIYKMYSDAQQLGVPFFVLYSSAEDSLLGHANNFYRFVHDVDHAQHFTAGRGTTKLKDELFLNLFMCKKIHDIVLKQTSDTVLASKVFVLLYHDLIGQAIYYSEYGDFVDNQLYFTLDKLQNDFHFCCIDNADILALYVMDLIGSVGKRIKSLS